ncbi:MAG: hydrogenase maturation nickel metallochaperone HypA [Chitinivibrionales bacterium]|nr:hydrogenase maturation nickel metallochaperone HypA [Chitinivibrionales bacterium]
MHEFNIGQTIVDSVLSELKNIKEPNLKLITTRVVIGKLRSIVPDYLQFAYENLSKDTLLQGSKLEVVSPPLKGTCLQCGWSGELKGSLFECASCGSTRGKLDGGRELYLENLEIEHD